MGRWICNSCKRHNSDKDLNCGFCATPKPANKTGMKTIPFGSNGSYPKVQRGNYECSKGSIYYRSKWEANYSLYLDFMVKNGMYKSWEFENKTFVFDKIQFGTKKYICDFEVINMDGSIEYHEVKGYMDSRSKTKLKRMQKYYPEVKLILIDSKAYNAIIKKLKGIIKFY